MANKLFKALVLTALAMAGMQSAMAAPPDGPVHSIAIVDIMPSHAAAGAQLLSVYIGQLRHTPGVASVALIQLAGTVNHFIVDVQYDSAATYQSVIQSANVLAFRRDLYPHLGSPWDERVGHDAAP